ncbi:MAG: HAMP domain-containing histidine kinase [Arcobacteraceae bacterium]|nr:HAMP domain-containing histidine kinase [Arcobacteraceae bacterium]
MINKTNDTKFIVIQVVLTLSIAFIPIYFYLDASFENQNIKDKMMLKNYSSSVVSKIRLFEEENSDFFYYPRSNIFTSAIFDEKNKPIFSLFNANDKFTFESEFFNDLKKICHKQYLQNNIFGAKYIITCKDINNSQVIYNTIILILTMTCLIFLSSFFTIKQSTEPYKKLNHYLDDFLKDAMHELKTPIGVARVNIDLLQMRIKEDKHLLRIKSALKNMSIIYEDLEYYMQRFSGIEEKKDIDLSLFLDKRVDFFNDLATAKNIHLIRDIQSNIILHFNEIELYRIIDNNLSNAIKYSKEKSTITITLQKSEDKIHLIFEDQGIGIKDTSKIFDRYYRGDKITGGFGIGLSIVKNICVKNNIKISVASQINKGSTFSYIIDNNFLL